MSRLGRRYSAHGARTGDEIWVTGTIGDGALGLAVARGQLSDPTGYLLDRYHLPQPRIGLAIGGIASAAMDVSDGLVQDLEHLCRAAGLAAEIAADQLPLSAPARAAGPDWLPACLTGGDDYELLMAIPPGRAEPLRQAARAAGMTVTRIGHFRPGPPLVIVRDPSGTPIPIGAGGWSHF